MLTCLTSCTSAWRGVGVQGVEADITSRHQDGSVKASFWWRSSGTTFLKNCFCYFRTVTSAYTKVLNWALEGSRWLWWAAWRETPVPDTQGGLSGFRWLNGLAHVSQSKGQIEFWAFLDKTGRTSSLHRPLLWWQKRKNLWDYSARVPRWNKVRLLRRGLDSLMVSAHSWLMYGRLSDREKQRVSHSIIHFLPHG